MSCTYSSRSAVLDPITAEGIRRPTSGKHHLYHKAKRGAAGCPAGCISQRAYGKKKIFIEPTEIHAAYHKEPLSSSHFFPPFSFPSDEQVLLLAEGAAGLYNHAQTPQPIRKLLSIWNTVHYSASSITVKQSILLLSKSASIVPVVLFISWC